MRVELAGRLSSGGSRIRQLLTKRRIEISLTVCVCTYRLPIMNRLISYDECNCFALRQAARRVTQIYERHLGAVGLTAAQFTILAKLARKPSLPMADLADAMVMERTTLVRAMKPLQRDGL